MGRHAGPANGTWRDLRGGRRNLFGRPSARVSSYDRVMQWLTGPLLLLVLLLFAPDLGPAWSARSGHGRPGIWTVSRLECGSRGGCTAIGDFVSDDGRLERRDIGMYDSGKVLPGLPLRAVDTGGSRVFRPDGGWTPWQLTATCTGLALALAWWVLTLPVAAVLRRRSARRPALG